MGLSALYTLVAALSLAGPVGSQISMFMPGVEPRSADAKKDDESGYWSGDSVGQKKKKKGDSSTTRTQHEPQSRSPGLVPGAPGHNLEERLHFLGVNPMLGSAPANPWKVQSYRAQWASGTRYALTPGNTPVHMMDHGAALTPGGPRCDKQPYMTVGGRVMMGDGRVLTPATLPRVVQTIGHYRCVSPSCVAPALPRSHFVRPAYTTAGLAKALNAGWGQDWQTTSPISLDDMIARMEVSTASTASAASTAAHVLNPRSGTARLRSALTPTAVGAPSTPTPYAKRRSF